MANLRSGWHAAMGAMLAEWTYRALTSGFYGAMTQTLGETEPEWQGAVAAMALLPLLSHSLEFLVLAAAHAAPEGQHRFIHELDGDFDPVQFLRDAAGHHGGRQELPHAWPGYARDAEGDWRLPRGDPVVGCPVFARQ